MAVATNSLKRGDAHFGFGCYKIVESAQALHSGLAILFIDNGPMADNVVGDNEAAPTRELDCPLKIVGRILLIRVDIDEIKRSFVGKRRE